MRPLPLAKSLLLLLGLATLEAHVYDRAAGGRHAWKELAVTGRTDDAVLTVRAERDGVLVRRQWAEEAPRAPALTELTNGLTLIQLIEEDGQLVDCDIVREQGLVDDFVNGFFQVADWRADDLKKAAELISASPALDGEVPAVDWEASKSACRALQKDVRKRVKHERKTHPVAREEDLTDQEVQIEEEDVQIEAVKEHVWNAQRQIAQDEELVAGGTGRAKRAMFIYPGTKWCGSGTTASAYHDLGDNIETDKCCRSHDHCTVVIEGFSSKYNYFNYRFHTLSHCECDDQFHSCLRTSGDSVSEMVGRLFFDVIGNKCFILNKEKTCKKRSWWGRCVRYGRRMKAELRKPLEWEKQ